MTGQVKGSLFVDYVRMLRSRKDIDWRRYLQAEDLPFLSERILLDGWYPMATFERLGLAILAEITRDDLFLARAWGRMSAEFLVTTNEQLLVPGDPRESIMRVFVFRRSFFDFEVVSIPQITDDHATLHVHYGMSPRAEQAAAFQTLGFFGRLVELAGASGVMTQMTGRSWEGDPATEFTIDWRRTTGSVSRGPA